jgi:DNA modification methylase
MCWDSTKIEDVEKVTEWVTISMVFSDPPYNIDYQDMTWTHKKIKNDKMSDEDFVQFLKDSIYPNCETQYVCCSWQYVHLFRRAMEESWLPVKSFIVWDKVNPAQNLDKYYKQHEIILYSWKFWGQKTVRWDVWTLKRQRNTVHPTMKPIELIEMALTDNRDMFKVYDAFLWSWSILIACEKTNRICYWMELDPKYIEVIIKRYHQYTDWKKDIKCLNREIDLEEVYWDNKIIPVGEAEDNHYGKTN